MPNSQCGAKPPHRRVQHGIATPRAGAESSTSVPTPRVPRMIPGPSRGHPSRRDSPHRRGQARNSGRPGNAASGEPDGATGEADTLLRPTVLVGLLLHAYPRDHVRRSRCTDCRTTSAARHLAGKIRRVTTHQLVAPGPRWQQRPLPRPGGDHDPVPARSLIHRDRPPPPSLWPPRWPPSSGETPPHETGLGPATGAGPELGRGVTAGAVRQVSAACRGRRETDPAPGIPEAADSRRYEAPLGRMTARPEICPARSRS